MSRKTLTRCMILGLLMLLLAVPSAYAGFGGSATPNFPNQVVVGATENVQLTLAPTADGSDSGAVVTLAAITLIPSCGERTGG